MVIESSIEDLINFIDILIIVAKLNAGIFCNSFIYFFYSFPFLLSCFYYSYPFFLGFKM